MNESERFWVKVEKTDGCWLWTASFTALSYGQFKSGGRMVPAHRWAYEHLVGPIPDGLELDHLCRVRHCVRPSHLEPVTHRENIRRGASPGAVARRTDRCQRGHSLIGAYIRPDRPGNRTCRICNAEAQRRYKARRTRSQQVPP